jgi:hypothetical protein
MQFIFGTLMIILFLAIVVLPPSIIGWTSNDANVNIAALVTWVMFGLGYIFGKKQQRREDEQRVRRKQEEKEIDEHDRKAGIGKYHKS